MLSSVTRSKQARLAGLKRHGADREALATAESEFRAARLEDYIRKTVDAAPPLDQSQRDRLALLLRGRDVA